MCLVQHVYHPTRPTLTPSTPGAPDHITAVHYYIGFLKMYVSVCQSVYSAAAWLHVLTSEGWTFQMGFGKQSVLMTPQLFRQRTTSGEVVPIYSECKEEVRHHGRKGYRLC